MPEVKLEVSLPHSYPVNTSVGIVSASTAASFSPGVFESIRRSYINPPELAGQGEGAE